METFPHTFATTNKGKASEHEAIFRELGVPMEIVELGSDNELEEIQHVSTRAVAAMKAVCAYHKFGRPVLVEDLGLHINGFNEKQRRQQPDLRASTLRELPGALIKHFEQALGIGGIALHVERDEWSRRAIAAASIAYASEDGRHVHVVTGEDHGTIAYPHGKNGFGFDPIFIPESIGDEINRANLSYGEMTPEMKNSTSMRRKAIEALLRGEVAVLPAPRPY